MEWTVSTLMAFAGLLAAGVANWVIMNNKVTRLETKIENIEKDRDTVNKQLHDLRIEIKSDYQNLHDTLMKIMMKLGVS